MTLAKLVWWGGLAAILGGVLEILVAALVPSFGPPSLTARDPVLYQAAILLGVLGSPLLAAGLAGLYALLIQEPKKPRLTKSLGVAGLILAGLASLLPLIVVLQSLVIGRILVPPQPFFSEMLLPFELWGLPLAATLLGVAALWSGGPMYWRSLPLILSLLMVLGLPYAILGFGWILLGCVMLWSSREKRAPQPAYGR